MNSPANLDAHSIQMPGWVATVLAVHGDFAVDKTRIANAIANLDHKKLWPRLCSDMAANHG